MRYNKNLFKSPNDYVDVWVEAWKYEYNRYFKGNYIRPEWLKARFGKDTLDLIRYVRLNYGVSIDYAVSLITSGYKDGLYEHICREMEFDFIHYGVSDEQFKKYPHSPLVKTDLELWEYAKKQLRKLNTARIKRYCYKGFPKEDNV